MKSYRPKQDRRRKPPFEPFVAIDFETWDKSNAVACSVGLAIVDAPDQIRQVYRLVRPDETPRGFFQSLVHGLTNRQLEDADPWPVVWAEIWPLIEGKVVYAHNAGFDKAVLCKCNEAWAIEAPEICFRCSMQMAGGGKLDALCEEYGIPLQRHHRADYDALSCALLVLRLMGHEPATRECQSKRFEIGECCADIHPKDRIAYDTPTPEISFAGKAFCFTGAFVYERELAIHHTEALGGIIKGAVSCKVDYLIVGRNGNDLWTGGDAGGGKVAKAMELKEKGKQICIVPECAWAEALPLEAACKSVLIL